MDVQTERQDEQQRGRCEDDEKGAGANPRDDILGALAVPGHYLRDRFDFMNDKNEWRRLFSELLGTFFLVLVAAGGGMVNARFGGHAIGQAALVTAPGLMVGAIILFMGSVSGAHLNPGVSLAFAMRGDFPWKRVPGYIVAQFAGACLATLLLVALLGAQGTAGLTLPGPSISPDHGDALGDGAHRGARERDPRHLVGRAERRADERHGRRRLHRARRLVGRARQRRVDEHGALARPGARPGRRRGLVGLSRRADRRRGDRRRHRVRASRTRRRLLRQEGGAGRPRLAVDPRPDRERTPGLTSVVEAVRALEVPKPGAGGRISALRRRRHPR